MGNAPERRWRPRHVSLQHEAGFLLNSGGPAAGFDRAAFINAFAEAADQVTR